MKQNLSKMLTKAIRKAVALERGSSLVKHHKSNTWAQVDQHKNAWREVYRIANHMANQVNAKGKRSLEASDIMDIYLSDPQIPNLSLIHI